MSYWDSSALVKLYVQELDSEEFRELALKASRVATGSLTRHEVRTVFRRREAEGVLRSGLQQITRYVNMLSAMDTEPGLRIMGSWSFCFPRTRAVWSSARCLESLKAGSLMSMN
jgi:predicted nucleic acid-binding protein